MDRGRRMPTVTQMSAALAALAHTRPSLARNNIPDTNRSGSDTRLFRPAMDSKGFFTVSGSNMLGANDISFGLVIDYGSNLLRVNEAGQKSLQLVNPSFQGT